MTSKQPSTTTQINKVELPAWVDSASQENYQLAQQIAAKPFAQYEGERVAPTSDTTLDAYSLFKTMPQTVADMDLNEYMNPFINDVVNTSMGKMNDARVQALMGNADKAIASKAFGGSRSAIVDAVTNSESIKDQGLLASQLFSQGYDKATGLAQGDIDNRRKQFAGLLGIGSAEQAQTQSELDAAQTKWNEANNADIDRLNVLMSALGMSPYGKTETATKTAQQGSSGTDFASVGAGLLSLVGGIFSDRTEKTDIEKKGTDPVTGLDIYAYRYKGDPKSYSKVVGIMAQDVKKKFPEAVGKVGGKLVVNVDALAGALAGA